MIDGERGHAEIVIFKHEAGFDLAQVQGDRGLCPAQNNAVEQVGDTPHRPPSGEDFHFFHRFPAHERGKQTCKAENVIEMAVGDQDFVESFKADPGFEDLPLGAFPTVNEKAVFVVDDDLGRKPPVYRRGRGGGA